jgi:hypothetical protein
MYPPQFETMTDKQIVEWLLTCEPVEVDTVVPPDETPPCQHSNYPHTPQRSVVRMKSRPTDV